MVRYSFCLIKTYRYIHLLQAYVDSAIILFEYSMDSRRLTITFAYQIMHLYSKMIILKMHKLVRNETGFLVGFFHRTTLVGPNGNGPDYAFTK